MGFIFADLVPQESCVIFFELGEYERELHRSDGVVSKFDNEGFVLEECATTVCNTDVGMFDGDPDIEDPNGELMVDSNEELMEVEF